MKKINNILLIDDNIHDNYIHSFVINSYDPEIKVFSVTSGDEALAYFAKSKDDSANFPFPEIVFLDINMPGMNGFEFLDRAKALKIFDESTTIVVIMLTSSLNPIDTAKADEKYAKEILEFRNKPLTVQMLREIIDSF